MDNNQSQLITDFQNRKSNGEKINWQNMVQCENQRHNFFLFFNHKHIPATDKNYI